MRTIKLPAFQNATANTKTTLRLPLGVCYQKIYLRLGTNVAKAVMSNIVLRLNNKEFMRWNTAADMDVLNAYKGNAINASFLVIDFTERQAREEVGMTLGTIAATQEAGVQDFTLEIDMGNFTPSGFVLEAYADVESPSANKIISRVMVQQKTLAAASEEMIYLPFGPQGFQLKRLIIKNTNLANVRVRRDGVEIYEALPVALANFRQQDFRMTPQAGYHVVDFMPDVLVSNALNTAFTLAGGKGVPVQNLDVRATVTGADTLTIYAEGYALNGQL
ncbi:major capsid protein P2 [Sphaerotilus mobilis]|uniref:Uncharacterized protein n=1 Tax=Sphaerotilus mobilis TaxID=47994 RepID=A0A4Q7LSR8_9BURK|nr:major capsid protein P2 [Sphaerotilus mobilis]RZS56719.1 hypothetical protein EV685_1273 [Sphaerotilus mobilis]